MTVPDLQSVAQLFTGRLLNTAAEGVVLAGMVWVLLRLIGRQNSGTRFAIWFSALLAIVALPFLPGSGFAASHSRALPPANLHLGITLPSSWASYLFAAWGVVAGLLLLRLSVGLWRVRQIRRKCSPVDLAGLDPAIAGTLRDFGSRRRVKVCVSSDVAVPAAIAFFGPAIVFPAWLLPQLSPGEMKVILLHELAHIQRWDDWTNLAQKIVKAVFFFHPAVWWIESRLMLEREMACDDIVLAQTESPRAYASSLISFAEKLQNARALTLVQTLGSRMRDMSLRVAQILDTKRPSRTGLGKPVLGLSAGLLVLVFGAAHYAPRWVAFQTQPQQRQTQHIHAIQQATDAELQPAAEAAGATRSRTAAALDSQRSSLAPQPRVIPAVFNPRPAVVTPHLKATSPRKPVVLRARATPEHLPIQETFVILRTIQYDASGARVWTLCIWTVGGENSAERQVQSAIVLSSI
jgi:beta-lactamase regulating signal transducer with metallopeptidase domain